MGESAEELRRDIDRTREHMTMTVDAIEDRVMPGRIIQRKTNRVKGGVASVRDAVMGAPHQVHDAIAGGTSGAGDVVGSVQSRTGGNPFAAGLIAFGAGMLAATLFPASEVEKQTAAKAKDAAEPLVEPLQDAAHQVLDQAKEHGQEAVEAVKEAGTSAAGSVTEHAKAQAQDTAETAKQQAAGQA